MPKGKTSRPYNRDEKRSTAIKRKGYKASTPKERGHVLATDLNRATKEWARQEGVSGQLRKAARKKVSKR